MFAPVGSRFGAGPLAMSNAPEDPAETAEGPRLTRLQALLGQSRECLARCANKESLLKQFCSLAVHSGGMRMAWIGLVEGATQRVLPVASCGDDADGLAGIPISIRPGDPGGSDPIAAAIRGNRPFWSQDVQHDPAAASWQERARGAGWASAAFLPLHHHGKAIGALCVYSQEAGTFDAAARSLLIHWAADISSGLQELAAETERQRRGAERDRLFKLSLDLLCVAGFDGRFRQLNPAWSATLGWSLEELLSRPWLDFVHPEDREGTLRAQEELARGVPVLEFENRYRCRDGSYRWLSWNSFPVPEEGLLFAVVRDSTGRKLAEEERRQVFGRISDAFVALDKDWRYTFLNEKAGQMFGRRPEDLIGRHIWTEFPEGVGQPFHRAYEQAMSTQQPVFLEEYYPPYDRWFENRNYPSPEGLTIYFQDITDRKRAELALRVREEQLRLFVENSPAAIALLDRDLNYLVASRRWRTDYQLGD